MKHDTDELVAVQSAILDGESTLVELLDLQLALVGGGTGEVVIA